MAKKGEKWQAKQKAKASNRAAKAARHAAKNERRQQRRKAQAVLSPGQMAEQLRALAAQVESGTVVLGDKELQLPHQAEFEISYKLGKKGGHQIEVEIEWGGPKKVTLLPAQ